MRFDAKIIKRVDDQLTIAMSGGLDSTAIAHQLVNFFKHKHVKVRAFYFNHRIRPQNNAMEATVRNFCHDFSIPYIVKHCKIPYTSGSKEDFYRKQRYDAMENFGTVVTGHHLSDFMENFLDNTFKGHEAYLPMPLVTEYKEKGFTIVRPYCISSKKQILEYAKKHDLMKYVVEDETNLDNSIQRNWLRNVLIPQIQEKNYNVERVVLKKIKERIDKL